MAALHPITGPEPQFERRRFPRTSARLGVTLVSTTESDPDAARISGCSTDIGPAGVQVVTLRPVPSRDPITIMNVPSASPLMTPAHVVAVRTEDDGWHYCLAFSDLRPADSQRLAQLVSSASAAPRSARR